PTPPAHSSGRSTGVNPGRCSTPQPITAAGSIRVMYGGRSRGPGAGKDAANPAESPVTSTEIGPLVRSGGGAAGAAGTGAGAPVAGCAVLRAAVLGCAELGGAVAGGTVLGGSVLGGAVVGGTVLGARVGVGVVVGRVADGCDARA